MSIYALYGGATWEQFATNRGYGDVIRWVQTLPKGKFPRLVHLTDWGWVNEIDELSTEIGDAMRSNPSSSSVKKTLDSFVARLEESNGESVMLSNGLSESEDDGDGEWWIDGELVTEEEE